MLTRRQFFVMGALVGAGALTSSSVWNALAASQVPQIPLPGANIPQFVEPLPTFAGKRVADAAFQARMLEFQQKILPGSVYSALQAPYKAGTYVWGYKIGHKPASFPGHTVEAQHGTPTTITYVNDLPLHSHSHLESLFTIDQTVHWADPLKQMQMAEALEMRGPRTPYKGPIPTVIHLHGAEVPSFSDGGPNQWFTSDGRHGKEYYSHTPTSDNAAVYRYPNSQPATALWFHDHALGLTRINVFSGLAAMYLLRDGHDTGRPDNPLGLPAGDQEVELILQDRQFDTNGQLLFPDGTPANNPTGLNGPPPNPGVHPFWIPEFFGDVIVVNGKSWPHLEVEPRRYRFRIVNGSNARFFRMSLVNADTQDPGPAFWQIGTDGGLLDHPVMLNNPQTANQFELFLAPSERADILIDFAGWKGQKFTLMNDAPAPYPSGNAPDPATTANIMQFRVSHKLSSPDTTYNPSTGAPLRGQKNQSPAIVRLANPDKGKLAKGVTPTVKRQLVLVEVEGPGGPIEVLLNNSKWDGLREGTKMPIPGSRPDSQGDHVTELPRVGATEEWEIVNLTMDAHPIHVHLLQFQLINRQEIDVDRYRNKYNSYFPGGTYAGLKKNGTWGLVKYAPGTYIPGFGPPRPYLVPNGQGAIGGNPDVTPYLRDIPMLPDSNEAGWKDTIKVYPKGLTRLVLRWAPINTPIDSVKAGQNLYPFDPTVGPGYVWHCHILDHEDNEMMRPYLLVK
ncbi:MAG TPA: multicopper oxidase domain-containing protein [Ktedonobacteraceae bacterium]|nr:multicopper oxidase domain-containing protein [Ktedonobacteraceae bacterium]